MKKIQRFGRMTGSFFCEIFTTPKGFAILAYMVLCGFLYWRFADKVLLRDPLQYLTASLAPALIFHVLCMVFAIIVFCTLTFMLGTCWPTRNDIRKNLPNAGLLKSEKTPQPKLVLYRPRRKQGYAEYVFDSRGVTVERWETQRGEVESALDITIIGAIANDGKSQNVITFKARKGANEPERGTLYDN